MPDSKVHATQSEGPNPSIWAYEPPSNCNVTKSAFKISTVRSIHGLRSIPGQEGTAGIATMRTVLIPNIREISVPAWQSGQPWMPIVTGPPSRQTITNRHDVLGHRRSKIEIAEKASRTDVFEDTECNRCLALYPERIYVLRMTGLKTRGCCYLVIVPYPQV